jgi:hypothetical protein
LFSFGPVFVFWESVRERNQYSKFETLEDVEVEMEIYADSVSCCCQIYHFSLVYFTFSNTPTV